MHPLEIGLSFLEGLALIVSPCILPVLPLVLSSSIEGGRKRPFGIITGFVIAFTIFALSLYLRTRYDTQANFGFLVPESAPEIPAEVR